MDYVTYSIYDSYGRWTGLHDINEQLFILSYKLVIAWREAVLETYLDQALIDNPNVSGFYFYSSFEEYFKTKFGE